MAQHLKNSGRPPAPGIKGFTFLFNDKSEADEIEYARKVGTYLDTRIEEIQPFRPPWNWYAALAKEEQDFPGYPNAAMSISLREAMSGQGCCVLLNGEGGDEWAGGRRLYYAEELSEAKGSELLKSFKADVEAFGPWQPIVWLLKHGCFHLLPNQIQNAARRFLRPQGPNNFAEFVLAFQGLAAKARPEAQKRSRCF